MALTPTLSQREREENQGAGVPGVETPGYVPRPLRGQFADQTEHAIRAEDADRTEGATCKIF